MMIDDIQPQANIEQRWTLDLVELSWEIFAVPAPEEEDSRRRSGGREAILRRPNREGCRGHANGADTSEPGGRRNGAMIQQSLSRSKRACTEARSCSHFSVGKLTDIALNASWKSSFIVAG
jgi:hypothetical protein